VDERVVEAMVSWLVKPARWWHFWMPQSGLVGGAIMSMLLYIVWKFSHIVLIA
jgi:hypothetical protein